MTVQAQTPIKRSIANGVTTVFPYDFLLLDAGDLAVYLDDALADSSTYSISGIGQVSGGNVSFFSAPASGVVVSRVREMELLRLVDYQNAGDFKADTVDADFDRIWMALQDSYARFSRSLHVRADDPSEFGDLELPLPADRAGLFLAFDAEGGAVPASGTGSDSALRSDLAGQLAGSALVAYPDPVAPAYLKTVSDIINGLDVSLFRFIPTAKHAGIQNHSNSDDLDAYFTDAVDSGAVGLYIPRGWFYLGQLTIPSALKRIKGAGAATRLIGAGTMTSSSPWLFFNGQSDIDVSDFELKLDSTAYPTNYAMQFGALTRGSVKDIHMIDGGDIAIYAPGCAGTIFENILVDTYKRTLFLADTSPSNLALSKVRSSAAGTGVGVGITGGSYHSIDHCFVGGAGLAYFTISLYQTNYSTVDRCIAIGSRLEAIQITDGSFNTLSNNYAICGADHRDFGISLFSNDADIKYNRIENNTIIGSGGPGIGISAAYTPTPRICQLNNIEGNTIINPCQYTTTVPAAIELLGGAGCTGNIIEDNTCFDESAHMVYCVEEWTSGGNPNGNKIINNPGFGSALVAEAKTATSNSSEVYDLKNVSTTPTVTSTGGTSPTTTSGLYYKRRGSFVDVAIIVGVTNNNTGSGAIEVALPFSPIGGALAGVASVSGKALTAIYGTNKITIRNYDGTYPASTGETLTLTGTLLI